MLTSSEVEDEVDHSFFDSDADDGGVCREGGEKMEKSPVKQKLRAKPTSVCREGGEAMENPPVKVKLRAKQPEKANSALSQRTYGTINHRQKIDNNGSIGESKKNSCLSKEESKRRVSNVSSAASMSDKGISDSSDSEEEYKVLSKRPNKASMALLAELDDRDIYNQSLDETEEEGVSTAKALKWRNTQASKKTTRKLRSQIPSPTTTEEADSESRSSCRRSSTRHKPKKSSLSTSSRERRSTEGGAGSQDLTTSCTEESDDTVTYVSPLSSPDITPLQSLDLIHAEEGSPREPQQESVPSSGLSDTCRYEDSEYSLMSDSQLGGRLAACYPGRKNRKNFSFNNNDVRRIDQENQRLFQVLSRLSAESRPESAAKKKTKKASNSPATHLHHSAVNRNRDQKRIEAENQAFLKRLQSAKPTYGMKRSEQEKDYQRLASYYGGPVYPLSRPSSKKDRSSFDSNSVGPRSASSTNHSSRAVSTTTDSGSTPAPTSQKRCSYKSRFQT